MSTAPTDGGSENRLDPLDPSTDLPERKLLAGSTDFFDPAGGRTRACSSLGVVRAPAKLAAMVRPLAAPSPSTLRTNGWTGRGAVARDGLLLARFAPDFG